MFKYIAIAAVSSILTTAAFLIGSTPKKETVSLPCCQPDSTAKGYVDVIDGYKKLIAKMVDEYAELQNTNCKLKKRCSVLEQALLDAGDGARIPPQNIPVPTFPLQPERKRD